MDSPPLTSSSGGGPARPEASDSGAVLCRGVPTAAAVLGGAEPAADGQVAGPMRWVEPETLAELEADLESPELARGFARDYTGLWDQRFSRLAAAVQAENRLAALDAVISLRVTSAMVGAVRLSILAQALEDAIRRSDFVQAQALLGRVSEQGLRTVFELRAAYIIKGA